MVCEATPLITKILTSFPSPFPTLFHLFPDPEWVSSRTNLPLLPYQISIFSPLLFFPFPFSPFPSLPFFPLCLPLPPPNRLSLAHTRLTLPLSYPPLLRPATQRLSHLVVELDERWADGRGWFVCVCVWECVLLDCCMLCSTIICYAMLCYAMLCYPILSIPSHIILSHLIPSSPIPSSPLLSSPLLSSPLLSSPIPSSPILFHPIPSYPTLYYHYPITSPFPTPAARKKRKANASVYDIPNGLSVFSNRGFSCFRTGEISSNEDLGIRHESVRV